MENIELSRKIDEVEVKAITVFTHPSQFSIKLIDDEFKGCLTSSHISYYALGRYRFIESDNKFSDDGLTYANNLIDNLYRAKNHIANFNLEIQNAVSFAACQITKFRSMYYKKMILYQNLKKSMKNKFKKAVLSEFEYSNLVLMIKEKIFEIHTLLKEFEHESLVRELKNIEGLLEKDDKCNFFNRAIVSHAKQLLKEELSNRGN